MLNADPVVVEVDTCMMRLMLPSMTRPSNTPHVQVCEGDSLAFISAPIRASALSFGSGVRSFTNATPAVPYAHHPSTVAKHRR
jgi:hypothetical protein